jgi:hypothetical protein
VLLDALNRQRGKGQQKVTVEHVHVHSGGQVVVGVVEAPGGGVQPKSEDQPHASEIANDLGIASDGQHRRRLTASLCPTRATQYAHVLSSTTCQR